MSTDRDRKMPPFPEFLPTTVLFLGLTVIFIPPVNARQTSISGSLGVGADFRDRTYDNNYSSSEEDQQRIFFSPSLSVTSLGIYDQLSLKYSPRFNYDFFDEKNTIDHHLSINAQRRMNSRWSLSFTEQFKLTDDTETTSYNSSTTAAEEDVQDTDSDESSASNSQDTLSRDQTNRRYWTNALSLRSSYALFEHTAINGGYTYSVLRNEKGSQGSDYDEYDKHAFSTNLSHEFNAHWQASLGLNYSRGLYKDQTNNTSASSDLSQYGVITGLNFTQSRFNTFPLKYSLSKTDYDADTRRDTTSHEWSLGWAHSFDPHTQISLGGGPSYAETDGLNGSWGYNAYLTLSQKYLHTTFGLQLSKQFETNNFSGTDESGLEDTYNARFQVTHQSSKDLGFNMFARYSKQSQIDPQGKYLDATGTVIQTATGDNTYDKDIYEAGFGLRYALGRWSSLGLNYSYYVSDGQLDSDQYDEHRIMVSLNMAKELLRW